MMIKHKDVIEGQNIVVAYAVDRRGGPKTIPEPVEVRNCTGLPDQNDQGKIVTTHPLTTRKELEVKEIPMTNNVFAFSRITSKSEEYSDLCLSEHNEDDKDGDDYEEYTKLSFENLHLTEDRTRNLSLNPPEREIDPWERYRFQESYGTDSPSIGSPSCASLRSSTNFSDSSETSSVFLSSNASIRSSPQSPRLYNTEEEVVPRESVFDNFPHTLAPIPTRRTSYSTGLNNEENDLPSIRRPLFEQSHFIMFPSDNSLLQ